MNPSAERTNADSTISVLSVGPMAEDHTSLRNILESAGPAMGANFRWQVRASFTARGVIELVRASNIPIVVCENDLHPGAWREMLARLAELPNPPLVIIASRHADDYLWVEALNLGAYDVLAKPFEPREVTRTLILAWQRWTTRSHPKTLAAGHNAA